MDRDVDGVFGGYDVYNGMAATQLDGVAWQKSRHSNSQGSCVEFARLPGGEVAVRNSRFPDGPALVYTRAEIEAMLLGVKDGEFDHLITRSTRPHPGMPVCGRGKGKAATRVDGQAGCSTWNIAQTTFPSSGPASGCQPQLSAKDSTRKSPRPDSAEKSSESRGTGDS